MSLADKAQCAGAVQVCPAIETLAAQVEALWTSVLPEDQFGLLDLDQVNPCWMICAHLDPAGRQGPVSCTHTH